MSSILSGLGSATVNAVGETVAFAGGLTGARALDPLAIAIEQEAFKLAPIRVPDALLLAAGVAQGQVDPKTAATWATATGFNQTAFDAMVNIANVGPGSAYAFELWRRKIIGEDGFRRAVKRLGWEQEWIDDAVNLKTILLSAEQVAVMLQRSVIPNQGQLPGVKRAAQGKVPQFPEVPIDAYMSAEAHGFTNDQVDALARIQGLPPGMDLVARMVFRKILDRSDFTLAAEQANRRVEWADFEYEGYRQIPTAEQFVEAHLRGWIDKPAMYAGTALHGMSQPDTDIEFQIHRRPLTPRQITQALAWGGTFNPEAGEITDPYSASVHQNSLGPEWYGLGEALKHTYSVPFWWRSMVQSGDLAPQEAETILLRLGNPPAFATSTTQHFAGGTTAATDPHVTKAQNQLWTTAHRSFVAAEIDSPTATSAIEAAGVAAASASTVLTLWGHERSLVRKQLTPAQVKKAFKDGLYTQTQALDALLARGYDQADATTLLEE